MYMNARILATRNAMTRIPFVRFDELASRAIGAEFSHSFYSDERKMA
jgi:hypothetical protein